jgi:hypothetical protein
MTKHYCFCLKQRDSFCYYFHNIQGLIASDWNQQNNLNYSSIANFAKIVESLFKHRKF